MQRFLDYLPLSVLVGNNYRRLLDGFESRVIVRLSNWRIEVSQTWCRAVVGLQQTWPQSTQEFSGRRRIRLSTDMLASLGWSRFVYYWASVRTLCGCIICLRHKKPLRHTQRTEQYHWINFFKDDLNLISNIISTAKYWAFKIIPIRFLPRSHWSPPLNHFLSSMKDRQ